MENPLKRFGAWGIALRRNLFVWARIKLSFLYLVIIAGILAFYSFAIYRNVADRVREDPSRVQGSEEQGFSDRAIDETKDFILIIDGVVFVVAAGLSYLLAGYTLRPIRDALTAQESFSADASHELRTPLTVMRTDIEVLLRSGERIPERTRKVLLSNLEEIRSLSSLSEELLSLARGGATGTEAWTNLDLAAIVRNITERFNGLAATSGIALSVSVADPVSVRGDGRSLERVLINLLSNALAYTPRGGSVTVTLARKGRSAVLTVADTGIGIPKVDLPHVFDRFYKVDHARTDGGSGAGLGLSIVRQIVDRHHGTICLESEPKRGTTVSVWLPVVG
jgi:signal transduction histidine kinase